MGSFERKASTWEGVLDSDLALHWQVPRVELYASVGSTSDVARQLAEEGAPAGTVVLADEQRAGRGRGARQWASPAGLGLWVSVIGRGHDSTDIGMLPLRIGLAIACALDPWSPEPIGLKWPNDLILRGRKLGGILCEAAWDGHRLQHVIVGFGLNLLQTADEFPEEIRESAISLRAALGRPVSRFEIAGRVIAAVRPLLSGGLPEPSPDLMEALSARDVLAHRRVEVTEPETGRLVLCGLAMGIDASGALLLDGGDCMHVVRTGTVRPLTGPETLT